MKLIKWLTCFFSFVAVSLETFSQYIQPSNNGMLTKWSENTCCIGHSEYPRPLLERKKWINLNGKWCISIQDTSKPKPSFGRDSIMVPFPVESKLSGIQKAVLPSEYIWYKRYFDISELTGSCLLNFGAVDYKTEVFINGKKAGEHKGGYLPFSIEIEPFIHIGQNELIVKVYDPTDRSINPHGKQTLNPENIYYTASSGIWQTVWLEQLNKIHISSIHITPDIGKSAAKLFVKLNHPALTNMKLEITIDLADKINITKYINITKGSSLGNIDISIPNLRLWTPDDPYLYNLSLKLTSELNKYDEVSSYFGMRKIDIQKDEKGMDRIFLNNKYTYNLGTLDQGFWPDGLYTAPNDEAMVYDIKAIKQMGFNTIRKHIKIEPERWYYYTDKLGILVWQDFVNPPHGLPSGAKEAFEQEVKETIDYLYNHPSIVTWVLFNEGWGSYNQRTLTKWVKEYDSTRLVNGHSGEMLYTDNKLRQNPTDPWPNSHIVDIHSYPFPKNTPNIPGKAKVIGEFGGTGVSVIQHEWNDIQGWGYTNSTAENFKKIYSEMTDSLVKLEKAGLSASIYTQPFDVEGEENGLITYDRKIIKIHPDTIRSINGRLVRSTKDLSDKDFFVGEVLDSKKNDPDITILYKTFKSGKKDSAFLRTLTLAAIKKGNEQVATDAGNAFLNVIKTPLSSENIKFIKFITRSSNDNGFKLFENNATTIDSVMGRFTSIYVIKKIIFKELATKYKDGKSNNWSEIQTEMKTKYGDIGEEVVLGKRMLQYGGYDGFTPDWDNYGKFYVLYFTKALQHPDYIINDLSWDIFLHVDDPGILNFAVNVVKYSIDNWDRSPEIFDTYANLLYKTQQTQKAIEWETKALDLKKGAKDEHIFAETLQKMKDNKPTWPQN